MKIKKQLWRAYAYSFLAYCGITQLWVIYLSQLGLSLVQVGLCESIFHVASFLFEVPSGVLADRFTYKKMLTLSRIAALISAAMMLWQGGFWWFAVSFIISAWSYNLQSGTLEALVYESLKAEGDADAYPHATSVMNAVIEVAATGGLLFAGLLVHGHMAWSYILAVILAALAMLVVSQLDEPTTHRPQEAHTTIKTILNTAWQVLKNDRGLFGLMGFDALFSALTTGFFYYFQQVMTVRHFPSWLVTTALAGASLAAIIAIRIAPRLLKHAKQRVLISLSILLCGTFLLASLNTSNVLVGLYLLNYALSALLPPIFNVYYNDRIPSEQRATLLSVASLLFSLAMIGLFPLLGWRIDQVGFAHTFTEVGIGLSAMLVISWCGQQVIKRH
ncbi:MFS transporter [Lacticaseibacillus porcinae]|uniref:MFS transporter n=1 Tax=Lacticaseibacillus porcinae TaxID=1123687 RepID=UPI0013DDDBF8|nr:MFS transporter [Lacticaseibacillus porcinae]